MKNNQLKHQHVILFVLIFLIGYVNFGINFSDPSQLNDFGRSFMTQLYGSGEESEPEDDEDDDNVDDEFEDINDRFINLEISESEIKVNSELRTGENKDIIYYNIKMDSEGLSIEIEYKKDSESLDFELSFQIIIRKIIEYTDIDEDGIFNESIDTLVKELALDDFNVPEYSIIGLPSGNNVYQINLSTSDGIFNPYFYFTEEFTYVDSNLVKPTEMKFDIKILNFDFENVNSRLALYTSLISDSEIEEQEETYDEKEGYAFNEVGINTIINTYDIFFSWDNISLIDGVEQPVIFSPVTQDDFDENDRMIFINYAYGNNITHDPKIGISNILRVINPNNPLFIIIIIISVSLVSIFGLMMTKQEYRDYLLNRALHINTGVHELSMEEVLDNEIRNNILNLIIDTPGIHYKELLRLSNTSASNLAWHLDILETYKIIHKQRVGQYLIYYPYLDKNPFANFDPKIAKSKTTLDIFQLVGDNPGIRQHEIARRMNLNHKTVKYHLDKILDVGLIYIQGKNNRVQYYAKIQENQQDLNDIQR